MHVPPVIVPGAVSDDVTVSPAAATQPPPVPKFFSTVTVNVCGDPTAFVELPDTVIRASTHVFVGFAESPTFVSPSDRVNGTPDTVNDTDADNVLVPTAELLTMIVH